MSFNRFLVICGIAAFIGALTPFFVRSGGEVGVPGSPTAQKNPDDTPSRKNETDRVARRDAAEASRRDRDEPRVRTPGARQEAKKTAPGPAAGMDPRVSELHGLFKAGKFQEAIPLAEALLRDEAKVRGERDVIVSSHAYNLGVLYLRVRRVEDGRRTLLRALEIAEASVDPSSPFFARPHGELATALVRAGDISAVIAHYERALDGLKRAGKPETLAAARYLEDYGQHMRGLARFEESERLLRQSLAIQERHHQPDDVALAGVLNKLAGITRVREKYADAEGFYKRAIAVIEKAKGPGHANLGILHDNLGVLYNTTGRLSEAEVETRKALDILEAALGFEHVETAQVVANLAELYRQQRRFDDAEPLFRRALQTMTTRLDKTDKRIGIVLDNLGGLYRERGNHARALETYKLALATLEASHPDDHPEVGVAHNNISIAHLNLGNHMEAERHLEKALLIAEKAYGPSHISIGTALGNMGDIHKSLNRLDAAKADYVKAVGIIEKVLGPEHAKLVWPLSRLGEIALLGDDPSVALTYYRRATAIHLRTRHQGRQDEDAQRPDAGRDWLLRDHIEALWRQQERSPRDRPGLALEAFELGQRLTLTSAGQAVTNYAARLAASGTGLGLIVRERQDAGRLSARLDKDLTRIVSSPPARRNRQAEARVRQQIAETTARIERLDSRIAREFPSYASLMRPVASSLNDVRKHLRDHEAIIQLLVDHRHAFAWLVTSDGLRMHKIAMSSRDIASHVLALRCGLDQQQWVGVNGPTRCLELVGEAPVGGRLPFDPKRAHALYQTLLEPFEAEIAGRDLFVVANGPLASLPFSALVTREDAIVSRTGNLKKVAWLARKHAVTMLPSVPSFVAIRRLGQQRQVGAARSFIGFGNPLLTGPKGTDRRAWTVASCKAPALADYKSAIKVVAAAPGAMDTYFRGGRAQAETVRRLAPLPETAAELCAVAQTLGSGESEVYLAADASEARLRALSADGRLAQFRVVHFATHGLIAGEIDGLVEPALVLTPPDKADLSYDGLLTASEVAELRLNADWVILSACNTASGDRLGAEALSGLARAFIYAGAKSLLVSHWPVDSQAAVKLTTRAIGLLSEKPDLGKAKAIRLAMLSLADEEGSALAGHPQIWAPFTVVGEGGGDARLAGVAARTEPDASRVELKPAPVAQPPSTVSPPAGQIARVPSETSPPVQAPTLHSAPRDVMPPATASIPEPVESETEPPRILTPPAALPLPSRAPARDRAQRLLERRKSAARLPASSPSKTGRNKLTAAPAPKNKTNPDDYDWVTERPRWAPGVFGAPPGNR